MAGKAKNIYYLVHYRKKHIPILSPKHWLELLPVVPASIPIFFYLYSMASSLGRLYEYFSQFPLHFVLLDII